MKKRIITLLAVLALLVTCAVFAVQATGDTTPSREPDAPGVNLTGDETCPKCGTKLSEITEWTEVTAENAATATWDAEHIWIKESIELPEANIWATTDQVILIRATKDFAEVPETSVVVTTTAGQITKNLSEYKLSVFGDNATIQSSLANVDGGMFSFGVKTAALVIQGDVTLKTTGTVTAADEGGFVYLNKAPGTFKGVTFDGGSARNGGAVCVASSNTDTTFTDCVFKNCTSTEKAGAFWANASTATMTNVDFYNCSSANGGAIYGFGLPYNSGANITRPTIKMTDCSISDCTASSDGGAAYVYAGYVKLDNTPVSYCSAANGGAFYTYIYTTAPYAYARVEILNGSHISNCQASASGGAISVNKNAQNTTYPCVKVEDSNITDCTAATYGGAVYVTSGKGYVHVQGTSVISGCTAGKLGGAVYLANGRFELKDTAKITADADFAGTQGAAVAVYGGVFNMTGGTIENATAKSGIRVQNAKFYLQGGEVKGATTATNKDGAFSITGYGDTAILVLAGTGKVSDLNGNMPAVYNVLFNNVKNGTTPGYGKLQVANDWSGYANIHIPASTNKTPDTHYGSNNDLAHCGTWSSETFTAGGGHKGTLVAGGLTDSPELYGASGVLVICRATLMKNGEIVKWYITPATALKAAYTLNNGENSEGGYYAQLRCDYEIEQKASDAALVGVLDLNGFDLSSLKMNESSQLTLIDTETEAGNAGGTVALSAAYYEEDVDDTDPENPVTTVKYNTVAATEVLQTGAVTFDGKLYVTRLGDTVATVYPVEYKLTQVALRAASEGIYYKGSLKAHEAVGATMGIAVTVADEPADKSLEQYLYTEETASGEHNGVLVQNILNNATTVNAEKLVKARAYILVDGRLYMSDIAQYSLKGLVEQILENDLYTGQAGFEALHTKLKGLGYGLAALPTIQNPEEA